MNISIGRTPFVCLLLLLPILRVAAQDSFEVQVYESDIVPVDRYELDMHNIFVQHGNTSWEGTVAPSNQQEHLALEFTRGVTDWFEMGSYLLFAHRPDGANDFAGFRLRPRVKAPDEWNTPVGLSLSAEIGFPQLQYEPNHVTLEIRPIIDKTVGRWKFDINPIVTFAFNGPEAGEGMGLEPEGMIAYDVTPERLRLMVEYYTALGPAHQILPTRQEVHMLYPKVEYAFTPFFVVNAGFGKGLTDASDSFTWALRLTFNF
ncbi:MAG TPA: transporter [Bacteroidota bacterium]|nr:transporter [Bacteroidota bacterium]